jgi:hypothetical protein
MAGPRAGLTGPWSPAGGHTGGQWTEVNAQGRYNSRPAIIAAVGTAWSHELTATACAVRWCPHGQTASCTERDSACDDTPTPFPGSLSAHHLCTRCRTSPSAVARPLGLLPGQPPAPQNSAAVIGGDGGALHIPHGCVSAPGQLRRVISLHGAPITAARAGATAPPSIAPPPPGAQGTCSASS